MDSPWKLIHSAGLSHIISILLKCHQIPCKRSRFAANVHKFIHSIVDDLRKSLWIDSIPWWIKDYEVRLFFDLIYDLKDIPCDELAVIKTIEFSIYTSCLHGLLHDLHSYHLLCDWCKELCYRSGSTVEIKYDCILCVTHIGTRLVVESLRTLGICLEE